MSHLPANHNYEDISIYAQLFKFTQERIMNTVTCIPDSKLQLFAPKIYILDLEINTWMVKKWSNEKKDSRHACENAGKQVKKGTKSQACPCHQQVTKKSSTIMSTYITAHMQHNTIGPFSAFRQSRHFTQGEWTSLVIHLKLDAIYYLKCLLRELWAGYQIK